VTGNDGNVSSLLFVYNDITAQKQKNEEIEQLKNRSETIIQQNPIPMLITSAGFVVVDANEAFTSMSGFARDRLIGMSVREIKILEQKGEVQKLPSSQKSVHSVK